MLYGLLAFGGYAASSNRVDDVVGGGGVKDNEGKVQAEHSRMPEVWREYYEKLLNRRNC